MKTEKLLFLKFLFLASQFNDVFMYKVLGVLPMFSRSPNMVGDALMKGLAADGHHVTVVSPFQEKNLIPNYTSIHLDGILNLVTRPFYHESNQSSWQIFENYFNFALLYTESTLAHPKFQRLLRSDAKFDVIIILFFLSDALLGLGHHFNAPVILFSPFGATQWISDMVGSPMYTSYMPNLLFGYADKMTFMQRATNLWYYNIQNVYFTDILLNSKTEKMLQKFYPDNDMPSLAQLRHNVALVLLNSHVTISFPRPYGPKMIEVGGLHINRTIAPLPRDLQAFLDGADDGVILFSLGSMLSFLQLPAEKKIAILNTFKQYPRMRLLLKLDENVEISSHKSSDVLIQSWIPQHSVLAHNKLKMFVTHGGMSSVTEAVYFGKPVVLIPISGDQPFNAMGIAATGMGEIVPYTHLTENNLKRAFRKVLSNPSYAASAKITSDRFRHRVAPPLETAIHWVKHVAKNKGAPHLRSAAVDMPFYTYYNLDVYFALIAIILSIIIIVVRLYRVICKSCTRTTVKNDKQKSQ